MITVKEWAEIRHLHGSEGLSIRQIARHLGVARDTVAKALALEGPPAYARPAVPSAFDEYEVRVRQLLAVFPSMPATVIAQRVGWSGSMSWFRKKVPTAPQKRSPAPSENPSVYSP